MPGQRTQALTHLEGWELEALPPTRIKAGIPTDLDFFGIPRDGFSVWDTVNKILWMRIGGIWTPISGGGVRVTNSGAEVTTTGVGLALSFDTDTENALGWHSTSVNSTRLTAPAAGRYLLGGNVEYATNATGVRDTQIRVNGATTTAWRRDYGTAAGVIIHLLVTEWFMNAGDYAELVVSQSSGGNLNIDATAYSPIFWMTRV